MTETVLTIVEENQLKVTLGIAEQVQVVETDQMLTPTRPSMRVRDLVSTATLTPDPSLEDMIVVTAQAEPLTIADPVAPGQKLLMRIKDAGSVQPITFGSQYRGMGVTLPVVTPAGKTMYLGFMYNQTDAKWDLVAKAQEA